MEQRMNDLISRGAAIEICKSMAVEPNINPNFYNLRSKSGYVNWMRSTEKACTATDIEREINKLPAVDTIPVEWLEDKELDYRTTGDKMFSDAFAVVIGEWQKEQEVR